MRTDVGGGQGTVRRRRRSVGPETSMPSEGATRVNACVILRPNNFDPPVIFFPKLTRSKILTPSFSHTAVQCGHPTLRQVVSTWTCCGGRLAPRRVNEGYTAEPSALARLVCQAYHSYPGRTPCRPLMPQLTHSGCPQRRASPQATTGLLSLPTPACLAPAYF